MPLPNILKKFQANLPQSANGHSKSDSSAVLETIYSEMIAVMDSLPQLRQEDFDLAEVRAQLILPVADYLTGETPQFLKPLFVSGAPGIGKTTLLMILDEVMDRLNASCREMVVSGKVTGYFAEKTPLSVTLLSLFGTSTAVLSARDWNNLLRHWTFDESTANTSEAALVDLMRRLRRKVVIVDEAELEGYVYFSELLAQHGVLVILSSNLAQDQIHLAPDHVRVITLQGSDHRYGDTSKVCLPDMPHAHFDQLGHDPGRDREKFVRGEIDGVRLVYFNWNKIKNHPLMKDDFARYFVESEADAVLLDAVPFFAEISPEDIDLSFLGQLSRFVNFVDAIHDCQLPLLIRGSQQHTLDSQTAGIHLFPVLMAYDQRTGSHHGRAAWIEWTRCLSRLRSREALNAHVWPVTVS